MKKAVSVFLAALILCASLACALAQPIAWSGDSCKYAYLPIELTGPLDTRTGPGANYDEPGSFLAAGDSVTLLSRFYDGSAKMWWAHVEFSDNEKLYRVYADEKQFPDLNLKKLPEEYEFGTCTLPGKSVTGYYGPGEEYAAIERKLPKNASCTIFGYTTRAKGDYVQIECYDNGLKKTRRAWVPVSAVNDLELSFAVGM